MNPIGKKLGARGVSLIEVMLGVVIMVAAISSLALLAPKMSKAMIDRGRHTSANTLASSNLQKIVSSPYQTLVPTGSAFFNGSTPCDCSSNANWPLIPAGAPTAISGDTYSEQSCVNMVDNTKAPVCPGGADTGIKQVVVRVAWGTGTAARTFQTQNYVSRNEPLGLNQLGHFIVRYCEAAPGATTCPVANWGVAPAPHIAIYTNGIMADNRNPDGTVKAINDVTIDAPPGAGFALNVHADDHYPYHVEGLSVAANQTVNIDVPLVSTITYGGKLGGEVFVALDHPVISKIVAQISENESSGCAGVTENVRCPDRTEMLEIYNPTNNTYTLGGAGLNHLTVRFHSCTDNGQPCTEAFSEPDFSDTAFWALAGGGPTISLLPHSHLLIRSNDPGDAGHDPWPTVAPDIVSNNFFSGFAENLIPYKTGGAIELWVDGVSVVDTVRWAGMDAGYPAVGEGATVLAAGSLKPAHCEVASAIPPVYIWPPVQIAFPNRGIMGVLAPGGDNSEATIGDATYFDSTYVLCGMTSSGRDGKGTQKMNFAYVCKLSPEAIAKGVRMANYAQVTADGNSPNDDVLCAGGFSNYGMSGIYKYAKSDQADIAACGLVTGATLGAPGWLNITYGIDWYQYRCPADSIIVGAKNSPKKNDSWSSFYCAHVNIPGWGAFTNTCRTTGQFSALVRATRRGQPPGNFSTIGAPGNGWGEDYDTDNNVTNFGTWQDMLSLGTVLKNTTSPAAVVDTGKPATQGIISPTAYIQINDPISQPQHLIDWPGALPYQYTSVAKVVGMFTTDGLRATGTPPDPWSVSLTSQDHRTLTTMPPFTSLALSPSWNVLVSPTSPPQPCNPAPCDTNVDQTQLTLPHPILTPGDVDYGVNPDSASPYGILPSISQPDWTILTGTVLDGAANPLSGIPVRLDAGGIACPAFGCVEKITDKEGHYTLLVPGPGPGPNLFLTINARSFLPPNSLDTHYYDPWHTAATIDLTTLGLPPAWTYTNPAVPIVLANTTLNTIPPNAGTDSTISGTLTAAESAAPLTLDGITVSLRDNQGAILQSKKTVAGIYTFDTGLSPNQYFIIPVLSPGESADPPKVVTNYIGGSALTYDFKIRGVKATVRVNAGQPGVLVAIGKTGSLAALIPPPYSANQTFYTKISGPDGTVDLLVPPLPVGGYDLKCWKPSADGTYSYGASVIGHINSALACPGYLCPETVTEKDCP